MKYNLQIFHCGRLVLESIFFDSLAAVKKWAKQDTMTRLFTRQGDLAVIIQTNEYGEQCIIDEFH